MTRQVAEAELPPSAVQVEPLAYSVGLYLALDAGSILLRLALWQAIEIAAAIEAYRQSETVAEARCGWRCRDKESLLVVDASERGIALLAVGVPQPVGVAVSLSDAVELAAELREAVFLVQQMSEPDIVRAAIEGWA